MLYKYIIRCQFPKNSHKLFVKIGKQVSNVLLESKFRSMGGINVARRDIEVATLGY